MRWRRREGHQGADEKKAAQAKAWGLWLDCLPQTEIAEQHPDPAAGPPE